MISLFRSFRDDIARHRRRVLWRTLVTFSAVKLVLLAVIVAFTVLALSHALPGGWGVTFRGLLSSGFEAFFLLQMGVFGVAMSTFGPYGATMGAESYTRALMGAVEARDMAVAHAVAVIPGAGATTAPEETDRAQTVGPFAHPLRSLALHDGVYVVAALGGAAIFGLGVGLTVISLRTSSPHHAPISVATWLSWLSLPVVLMLLGVGGALMALVMRRFARMERQGVVARVDADGVTFRRDGRVGVERRLRWSDARGFARITSTDEMGRVHEVFVLSGPDEDFMWEAMYAPAGAAAGNAQREEAWRVAAHRLVELVSQRTGLPLLDLTQTIYATLASRGPSAPVWSLLARAEVIARADGDTAFARELASRLTLPGGPLLAPISRWGVRLGNPRNLTPEQRSECLRVARLLLPYYPTHAQFAPDARRRLRQQVYWSSEFALQLFVIGLAFANVLFFVTPPW